MVSSPHILSAYAQTESVSFTRAQLLHALFDALIQEIKQLARLQKPSETSSCYGRDGTQSRLRVARLFLVIIEGIRPDYNEIARRIHELCVFAFTQTSQHNYEAANRVLQPLRDAFMAILDDANQLEAEGQIPSISTCKQLSLTL